MIEELKRLIKEATALPWELLYEESTESTSASPTTNGGVFLDEIRLDLCAIGVPNNPMLINDDNDNTVLLQDGGELDAEEDRANLRLAHAAVNALPALIVAAEAVQAWEAAKTKRINALTGNGDLIEALRDVNVAENNLWLASELLKEGE